MKKFRGKALAALLSLALVASSFPVTLASARTRHETGVLTDGPDNDEFWLVNGGDKKERSVANFQDEVYSDGVAPLETADHDDVDDPEVYSISHVSGDRLVSWDIGDEDDDDEGDVTLKLRKSDSEGDEVLAILYKGTYTDDDDNDIDVTASTTVTVHAVDQHSTVVGDANFDYAGKIGTDSPELDGNDDDDDNFAKIGTAHNDFKEISVFRAEKADPEDNCLAEWEPVQTVSENNVVEKDVLDNDDGADHEADYGAIWYVLEDGNNSNLDVSSNGVNLLGDKVSGLSVSATDSEHEVEITKESSNTHVYWYCVNDDATNAQKNATSLTNLNAGDIIDVYSADPADPGTDDGDIETSYVYRAPLDTTSSVTSDASVAYNADETSGVITDGTTIKTDASSNDDKVVLKAADDGSTYHYVIADGKPTDSTAYDGDISTTGTTVTVSASDNIYLYKGSAGVSDDTYGGFYSYTAAATTSESKGYTQNVFATVKDDAKTSNITFKAKVTDNHDDEKSVADDDDIKSKVKVEKKVIANDEITDEEAYYSVSKDDKKYIIELKKNNENGGENSKKEFDSGSLIKFDTTSSNDYLPEATISDDANVDGVKGKVKELTVDSAKKVGAIDLDAGNVSIQESDVKVDSITTKNDAHVNVDADNNVGDIKIKDDDYGTSEITMSAGSAKTITSKGLVTLEGNEDDEPISVGTLTAREITLDSDDGSVTVNKVVFDAPADDESGCVFNVNGDQTTAKVIDFAGYAVDMKTDDFQGELPAPENATADGALFETGNEDDDVTFTGDMDIDSVTIDDDDSRVVFNGKLSVNDLDGSGTMYIGVNKLYVGDDATGVLVKLTDSFNSGDTLFTAASDAVDEDDLDFYGTTVKKEEGNSTDKFTADTLMFAGLTLNETSSKIVLGESETFTATAYAPGTTLPEGYSVEFDIDDNSGVFELTDNGNGTATVKTVDYDDTFSEENKATLVAYLIDEDGDEDDEYEEAECKLTALKVPEVTFTSDTTSDFTLAPGASYQFKITATAVPTMTAGTAGVLDVTNVGRSGNDYFIKVTASADAAGKETGIYVNDTKLLVVKVAGSDDFTSDTTADFSIAQGSSYQYKITATSAPSFTLGTSGVYNYTLVSQSGNDYFYQITAVGASGAQTGVYVNGTLVNVVTVA